MTRSQADPPLVTGAVASGRGGSSGEATTAPGPQRLVIENWLPQPLANVHADHWRKRETKLKAAQTMAWASAKNAGWRVPVHEWMNCAPGTRPGIECQWCGKWSISDVPSRTACPRRHRLKITLVFPVNRRRDLDGLYARVKGVVDGLVKGGWIVDDDTEHLELIVRAEVRPGVKQTELLLEPIQ